MALYRIGSKGGEVKRIQERLKSLLLYGGPVDGDFGGGTGAAVKAFQKEKGLPVDGTVGPETWGMLFNESIPEPSPSLRPVASPRGERDLAVLQSKTADILGRPLDYRCLALTGSFETGSPVPECFTGISGDFDGQGISLGVLQWNFGQDSLQPLLKDMISSHRDIAESVFKERLGILEEALGSGKDRLMAFALSIQHPVKRAVNEPWKGIFKALGRTGEFQDIQLKYATGRYTSALGLCTEYGLWSERAAALMFDIKVQNGSIGSTVKARITGDFGALPQGISEEEAEVLKMRIIAERRAEAAKGPWIEDVRARKLCCANGRGTVHGIDYDLDRQFGIRLERFTAIDGRRI